MHVAGDPGLSPNAGPRRPWGVLAWGQALPLEEGHRLYMRWEHVCLRKRACVGVRGETQEATVGVVATCPLSCLPVLSQRVLPFWRTLLCWSWWRQARPPQKEVKRPRHSSLLGQLCRGLGLGWANPGFHLGLPISSRE